MNASKKENARQLILLLVTLTIGCFIYAFALDAFLVPGGVLSGGITGLSLFLNYEFGWRVSIVHFILNIPLFILVLIFLGKRPFLINLYGVAVFTLAEELFLNVRIPFESNLTVILIGGFLYGLGLGISYRYGGGSGGTDLLAMILNKYLSVPMSITGFVFNAIMFTIFAFIRGFDLAAMSLAVTTITMLASNYVCDGLDRRRAMFIITDKSREIADAILMQVGRGCTVMDVHGAYTHANHQMLYCVFSNWQVEKVKRIVKSTDPAAFLTVSETISVYGRGKGFKQIRDINS